MASHAAGPSPNPKFHTVSHGKIFRLGLLFGRGGGGFEIGRGTAEIALSVDDWLEPVGPGCSEKR